MPSSKWDSDRDEVEVDYARMDGPQPPRSSIFTGRKGMFLRIMIFSVVFLLGLIIGYALRRNVQEKFIHARVCAYKDGYQVGVVVICRSVVVIVVFLFNTENVRLVCLMQLCNLSGSTVQLTTAQHLFHHRCNIFRGHCCCRMYVDHC